MRKLSALATALVLALAVSGCGNAAEKVSEKIAEKALEQSGGGNVDIQQSGSGDETVVKVETDEGTMVIGGGEIPSDMSVPVPDGGDVAGSISAPDEMTVSLSYPKGDYDDVMGFYEDWASSGGFQKSSFSTESDGVTVHSTQWYSDDGNVYVSVTDNCADASGNDDAVCVSIIESR